MKDKITAIIKYALSNMALMQDIDTQASSSTKQIIEEFEHWLLIQAHRDSKRKFRQTKAYELYVRLTTQYPIK